MSYSDFMAPQANSSAFDNAMSTELIWQMGLASLSSNNNELVLPQHLAARLSQYAIEDLKIRLSQHIGAPTMAVLDQESQVFRIRRVPTLGQTGNSPWSVSSPAASTSSSSSATPAMKSSTRSAKSTVPRPPNAFILYRKDRHPVLKHDNPKMHNNDISVKVGKEWKEQSEAVKAEYKARAERIKQQHAIDNPGYQYLPRKPGDKKRRMTKKKLNRMRGATSAVDIADHVRSDADGDLPSELSEDDMPKSLDNANMLSAENYLDIGRSSHVSHPKANRIMDVVVTLPSNNVNITREYQSAYGTFVETGPPQATTSATEYVENDDAFFNSLIDWEGIARDYAYIRSATGEDMAELDGLQLGNPHLSLSKENVREAFHKELERTKKFF